jgi:hypothetical protein
MGATQMEAPACDACQDTGLVVWSYCPLGCPEKPPTYDCVHTKTVERPCPECSTCSVCSRAIQWGSQYPLCARCEGHARATGKQAAEDTRFMRDYGRDL